MTAANEHLIISPEAAWGTWVLPADAYPVRTAAHTIGRNYIDRRYTGSERWLRDRYLGAKAPSGSIAMDLWPEKMGRFLKAAGFSDINSVQPNIPLAPTAWEHSFLLEQTNALKSLSMQHKRSTAIATNVLGAIINSITLSVVQGEVATFEMEWLAKDEAPAGGTWDFDGSASPAVIATPSYIAATLIPFRFFDAVLILGGTPTLTLKKYTVAGGVAQVKVQSVEIAIANNLEQAHFLSADPTPGVIHAQNFEATVSMDIDQSALDNTFYNHVRAGTTAALQLTLTGATIADTEKYKFIVTLPELSFGEADWPELSGEQSRRVQSVSASAVDHAATANAIGITIEDTQTTY